MQVSPNQQLPASYTISAPGDTTLYYVRAVLRDTQSSSILQTLALAQVSTTPNRYSGVFDPVSDPSGLGRIIDITISVYTDAGYTTLSQNYAVVNLSYLVTTSLLNSGFNSGVGTDYKRIEALILSVLDKNLPKHIKGVKGDLTTLKKTGIKYALIESMIKSAHTGSNRAFEEKLKEHHQTFSDFSKQGFNELATIVKGFHEQTHGATMARLEELSKAIGGVGDSSEKGSTSLRSALTDIVEKAKKEIVQTHAQHSEKLSKSFTEMSDGVDGKIHSELNGKEVKFNLNMSGADKPEKKSAIAPDMHMERAKKLL